MGIQLKLCETDLIALVVGEQYEIIEDLINANVILQVPTTNKSIQEKYKPALIDYISQPATKSITNKSKLIRTLLNKED